MAMEFKELSLPKTDTRLVIFGDIVFKLIYKLCPDSATYTKDHHDDIVRLTKGVLKTIADNNTIHPLRTDNVVVFPGLTSWELGRTIQMAEYGRPLIVSPDVVLFVIYVIEKGKGKKRSLENNSEQTNDTKRRCITATDNKMEALLEDQHPIIDPIQVRPEQTLKIRSWIRFIFHPLAKLFKRD